MYDLLASINPTTHVLVFIHAKTFDSEPVEQFSFNSARFLPYWLVYQPWIDIQIEVADDYLIIRVKDL